MQMTNPMMTRSHLLLRLKGLNGFFGCQVEETLIDLEVRMVKRKGIVRILTTKGSYFWRKRFSGLILKGKDWTVPRATTRMETSKRRLSSPSFSRNCGVAHCSVQISTFRCCLNFGCENQM